jgi:tRNA (guanine-N7-)-methyltransferase
MPSTGMHFFNISEEIPPENREEALAYFARIFGNTNPLSVEIGSGNGHFLVNTALRHPYLNYTGVELFAGRARKFYSKVEKRKLENIAVYRGDARRFVWEFLYRDMVEEFFILFPDPWPKKRHHKHRLITRHFIAMLQHRLIEGGRVSIATDHPDYRDHILSVFKGNSGFISRFREGGAPYPEDYPSSIFEHRFSQQKKRIYFMQYIKVSPG